MCCPEIAAIREAFWRQFAYKAIDAIATHGEVVAILLVEHGFRPRQGNGVLRAMLVPWASMAHNTIPAVDANRPG